MFHVVLLFFQKALVQKSKDFSTFRISIAPICDNNFRWQQLIFEKACKYFYIWIVPTRKRTVNPDNTVFPRYEHGSWERPFSCAYRGYAEDGGSPHLVYLRPKWSIIVVCIICYCFSSLSLRWKL